jgi:hypothetical protein
MKSFEVLCARYSDSNKCMEVVKEIVNDDDSTVLYLHMFNTDILEWRAAEYGINDLDEIVDMIMHEPYMPSVPVQEVTAATALQLHRGHRATVKAAMEAKVGKRAARSKEDKVQRLRAAGVHQKYVDALDDDPVAVIKDKCPVDPETLLMKRRHVAAMRIKSEGRKAQQRQAFDPAAPMKRQQATQSQKAATAQKVQQPTQVTVHLRRGSKARLAD